MITRRTLANLLVWLPIAGHEALLAHAEWADFAGRLTRALKSLKRDEFLILETRGDPYYVQFACRADDGLRIEAVSNGYLPAEKCLSAKHREKLLELGWNPPTHFPGELDRLGRSWSGSPNYFLHVAAPISHAAIASLAIATLRGVYGAARPSEVQYTAFRKSAGRIAVPALEVEQRPGALSALIAALAKRRST